jgi:hypothetical protein
MDLRPRSDKAQNQKTPGPQGRIISTACLHITVPGKMFRLFSLDGRIQNFSRAAKGEASPASAAPGNQSQRPQGLKACNNFTSIQL